MKNKLVLNSAEDAEIISVRLDPERFPIAYANKVECLMLSGLLVWQQIGRGKI